MFRSVANRKLLESGILALAVAAIPSTSVAHEVGSGTVKFLSCSRQFSSITVGKTVAAPGQMVNVPVVFHPAEGWGIKTNMATIIKVFPPAGVTAPHPLLKTQDATLSAEEGRFDVALSSSEAGKKTIPAVLTFMVCTDNEEHCEPQIANVSIEMDVQ